MAFADLHAMGPAKQVERSDRQLQHAQALYEGYQAVMSPQDRDLAQGLLTYSGDLRCGWEAQYLPTRIRQARLYCSWVNDTLQTIQAAVSKVVDMRGTRRPTQTVRLIVPPFVCWD